MSERHTPSEVPTKAQLRFRRVEAIFQVARDMANRDDRGAYIARQCADDDALQTEVEAWLAGHEEAERASADTPPHATTAAAARAWLRARLTAS